MVHSPTGLRISSGNIRFPRPAATTTAGRSSAALASATSSSGGTPSRETLDFLRTLPFDVLVAHEQTVGVVVHGSPRSDMEFVNRNSHPPAVLRGYLSELGCQFLVVGHTHRPMWFRCPEGLVINPGSVVSMPVVDSSRTFALVDLDSLEPTFHDVESGRVVEVEPWH